jgi:hypothetical protein
MRSMRLALLLAAFTGPAMLAPTAARAEIYYPWCAVYGGDSGGASNCGFSTIAQCMATVSGIGGSCEPNPFYNPPKTPVRKRKRVEH